MSFMKLTKKIDTIKKRSERSKGKKNRKEKKDQTRLEMK